MPNLTKVVKPIAKASSKSKSYQLRLTITPQIRDDIIKARKKYKYLDDVEIIKIFIGRGSNLEFEEDKEFGILSNKNFVDDNDSEFENMYTTRGGKLKWI